METWIKANFFQTVNLEGWWRSTVVVRLTSKSGASTVATSVLVSAVQLSYSDSHVSVSAFISLGNDQKSELTLVQNHWRSGQDPQYPKYPTLQELVWIPRGANLSVSEIHMKIWPKKEAGYTVKAASYTHLKVHRGK